LNGNNNISDRVKTMNQKIDRLFHMELQENKQSSTFIQFKAAARNFDQDVLNTEEKIKEIRTVLKRMGP